MSTRASAQKKTKHEELQHDEPKLVWHNKPPLAAIIQHVDNIPFDDDLGFSKAVVHDRMYDPVDRMLKDTENNFHDRVFIDKSKANFILLMIEFVWRRSPTFNEEGGIETESMQELERFVEIRMRDIWNDMFDEFNMEEWKIFFRAASDLTQIIFEVKKDPAPNIEFPQDFLYRLIQFRAVSRTTELFTYLDKYAGLNNKDEPNLELMYETNKNNSIQTS